MDLNDIAVYAAQVIEDMAGQFGEDAVVRGIMVVLDVEHNDSTVTVVSCDDDRQWIQLAFLEEAQATVECGAPELVEDDED